MSSALLIVYRGPDGITANVPFIYKDGELLDALARMADYLADHGLAESFWQGVAGDRQAVICQQLVEIAELKKKIAEVTR